MKFIPTKLEGCFILEPTVILDERGYFMESFNEQTFQKGIGQSVHFVQDNQSYSSKGVLRGLVRVLQGEVLDVAVDIRPDSPTYGQYESVVLSGENQRQFFVPRGFAHGFLVLSNTATFFYKCDNFYHKESEGGVLFSDPNIGIDWGFPLREMIVSQKDKLQPLLENAIKVW